MGALNVGGRGVPAGPEVGSGGTGWDGPAGAPQAGGRGVAVGTPNVGGAGSGGSGPGVPNTGGSGRGNSDEGTPEDGFSGAGSDWPGVPGVEPHGGWFWSGMEFLPRRRIRGSVRISSSRGFLRFAGRAVSSRVTVARPLSQEKLHKTLKQGNIRAHSNDSS
ncbi:hypothetical protein Acsp01_66440 [Actinoplanes sp. NBRC 101535]|nr:hypothetical protein Acsp01_66440 [Actinoplanes sp. NBRC 101535]